MRLIVIIFFGFIMVFISCDKLPFKTTNTQQFTDTIIDFSSVDSYPQFKNCDSIINKIAQDSCFRATMHKKIMAALETESFIVKKAITGHITMGIYVNKIGVVGLDTLQIPTHIKKQLPSLDSVLQQAIVVLPKLTPAYKRGIPVTTSYQLPITLKFKE